METLKETILETRTNQYGEEVPTHTVTDMGDGFEVHKYLTCWGSSVVGMGTCRCISHDPYTEGWKFKGFKVDDSDVIILRKYHKELEASGFLDFYDDGNGFKKVHIKIPSYLNSHVVWEYDEDDNIIDIEDLKPSIFKANIMAKRVKGRGGRNLRDIFPLGDGLWEAHVYMGKEIEVHKYLDGKRIS